MAQTQMQLIQSLGEAMAWLQRELLWEVPATELRHLCGRVGELYAAVITNGQMALRVNQQGYDVVSATQERVSVKTTAMMGASGHITFNPQTLSQVDRIMVLRINTQEMQVETLLDAPVAEAEKLMAPEADGRRIIPLSRLLPKEAKPHQPVAVVAQSIFQEYVIRELESGTIEVLRDGVPVPKVLPVLRDIALELNAPIFNSNGNPFNTRQLGSLVIKYSKEQGPPADGSPESLIEFVPGAK